MMKLFAIRILGVAMLMLCAYAAALSEERREEGNEAEEERGETNEMQRGKVLGKVVGGIVGHLGEEERGAGDYSWMDGIDLVSFCSYCTSPDWKVTTDKAKKNCRKYCAHGHKKRGQTEEMQRGFRGGRSVDGIVGKVGEEERGETNEMQRGFRGGRSVDGIVGKLD